MKCLTLNTSAQHSTTRGFEATPVVELIVVGWSGLDGTTIPFDYSQKIKLTYRLRLYASDSSLSGQAQLLFLSR
jgi:hypothetical protein